MRESPLELEQLVDLASCDLDPLSQAALEEQLRRDPQGEAILRQLRDLIRLMPELSGESASAAASVRAVALFRRLQWALRLRAMVGAAGQAVARLVFDSRAQPALAGFRGDAASTQLAFDSDCGRINLQISQLRQGADERWRIRGQLDALDQLDDGLAALVEHSGGELTTHTDVDPHGRFSFDAPRGRYDLVIAAGENERPLVIPGVEIGWSTSK